MSSSPRYKDITGQVYGHLTALRYAGPNARRDALWEFACSCGSTFTTRASSVRFGGTKSCGCVGKAKAKLLSQKYNITHGMAGTPEWSTWTQIKARCADMRNANYGGRGISVCQRWLASYESFYEDMGARPTGTSIDRIDNNGPYSPDNCRWATRSEQARNRRSGVLLAYNGETMSQIEWAERLGISHKTLYQRIKAGWSTERSVTTPKLRPTGVKK